jgi:hypothetical protein
MASSWYQKMRRVAMSVRTTEQQRRTFYNLHEAGETYQAIAERFCVSAECVRLSHRKSSVACQPNT